VIHHQPKVTRQGPPGSASRRRIAAAPPGPHDQSEHLTCGNDDRGQPESSCRPGPDGGIRTAALHHLAGRVTASRCCPEVPAPQPRPPRTSPDDLAAELNPHKTELNPHKAVEAASRARTDKRAFRAQARARRHGSSQRRSCCHAARDPLCPSRSATATDRACARVAVRYATDDDCQAGCGHSEPAVLARRHRPSFSVLRSLGGMESGMLR
jgi:hypothetical protein